MKTSARHITDDIIMVERGIARSRVARNDPFEAPNLDAALEMVIADLNRSLLHVTGISQQN